jgi:Bacterial Ig domain
MPVSRSNSGRWLVTVVALVVALVPSASQARQDPRCSEPGVTILTDPVGDANPTTGNPASDDIERLSIAEPPSLGPGKVMFILKMATLPATLPGGRTWPVTINNAADPPIPDPTTPTDNFVVRMSTFPLGPPPTFSAAPGTSPNPVTNPGSPADPASSYATDGTIRIIVSRSQIGNPMPGQTISNFLVRIRVHGGAVDLTPDNMPDDLIPAGSYTLIGSENCNQAPVAVDDSAQTVNGFPVTINVVANDSDPDGDPLTVTGVSDPPNGTAVNNGDGTVTYTPDCGFFGTDSFTYTISDGQSGSDTGLVTVRNRKTSRRGSIPAC